MGSFLEAIGRGKDAPLKPKKMMMADGGEVDDSMMDEDVDEGLIVAAEDIMDCLGNGWDSPAPNADDNKIQKATKSAARRAKAKILAQALKSFFDQLG